MYGGRAYLVVPGDVLLPLVWPDFIGSEVLEPGAVLPVAVPVGVFGELIEPVVPLVDPVPPVLSGIVDDDPLIEPDDDDGDDGDIDDGAPPFDVEGDVMPPVVVLLPVVDVVDGFDIELSVFGVSALLQAPRAARVAAIATHLIELCMFSPRCGCSKNAPRRH